MYRSRDPATQPVPLRRCGVVAGGGLLDIINFLHAEPCSIRGFKVLERERYFLLRRKTVRGGACGGPGRVRILDAILSFPGWPGRALSFPGVRSVPSVP